MSEESQTLAEKIMSHRVGYEVFAGDVIDSPLDLMWGCSMTTYWAFKQLERSDFLSGQYDEQIRDHSRNLDLVLDHFILPTPDKLVPVFDYLRGKSEQYGFEIFEPGHNGGIQHRIFEMMGMLMPGDVAIGADSHSTTGGALGAMSTGVGSTDLAVGMLTGKLPLKVPESIKVNLVGELREEVNTKDLIMYLSGLFNESGANYQALEYVGPGVASIPMHQRFIPANMAVELGAKTGLFPVDGKTIDYLRRTKDRFKRSRFKEENADFYLSLQSDDTAQYSFEIEVDLGGIPPMVAFPFSPSNVLGIEQARYALKHWNDMPDIIREKLKHIVEGHDNPVDAWPIPVNGVYWGGCTNGRMDDYAELLPRLHGRKFAETVDVVINPASEDDMIRLQEDDIWQEYERAGARTEGSKCGMCFGASSQWGQPGYKVQVTNRNFKGRFGEGVKVLLTASHAATESAIQGVLASPVEDLYEDDTAIEKSIANYVEQTERVGDLAQAARYKSEMAQYDTAPEGAQLTSWTFGSDINTDQMMNAEACKLEDPNEYMRYLLRDGGNNEFNDHFASQGYDLSSDVIVGGYNFGCGSSRENAPESVKLSKTPGIVAGSFARIFWRNSINLGVPLYEIGDAVNGINEGDQLVLDPTNMRVYNTTNGHVYQAKALPTLSREILDSGGVMDHIKMGMD